MLTKTVLTLPVSMCSSLLLTLPVSMCSSLLAGRRYPRLHGHARPGRFDPISPSPPSHSCPNLTIPPLAQPRGSLPIYPSGFSPQYPSGSLLLQPSGSFPPISSIPRIANDSAWHIFADRNHFNCVQLNISLIDIRPDRTRLV